MAKPVSYANYLKLGELLSLQAPESAAAGRPAHDEMLFITVHQVYELWFKQILFELDRIDAIFAGSWVDDRNMAVAAHGLARIVEILRLGVRQVDLLETMTPLDFLQFREVEVRLGLRREQRHAFEDQPYERRLAPAEQRHILELEQGASLADLVEAWLARLPFMETAGWRFREAYRAAVAEAVRADIAYAGKSAALSDTQRAAQIKALEDELARFDSLFVSAPEVLAEPAPGWRMGRPAVLAALFINLYRDEPALQVPFRFLSLLMDVDETLTTWRFRHAQMVERMIGRKLGTGGSSGYGYLHSTVERHRVFADLFALATFLMPRAARPDLPEEVRGRMALAYAPAGSGEAAPA